MGRIKEGILGGFSGKVGPVVGSSWKGINYMRGLGKKRPNRPSPKQREQRARFKMAAVFMGSMVKLLNLTFRNDAIEKTGYNVACGYTVKNVVTGDYPSFKLNFPNALIAKGSLQNATAPTASAAGSGNIKFEWTDNSGKDGADANDNAILVCYCEEKMESIYSLDIAVRSDAGAILNLAKFTGKNVHTWISFIAASGEVASSVYTGSVVVV